MFTVSDEWKTAYPGAAVGVLVIRNAENPEHLDALDQRKDELERQIRARWAGKDKAALRAIPTLRAYAAYYQRFDKSYHVQLQLESVALKGKSIPRVAALVEAMFMAELKNLLLTAGHDLQAIQGAVRLDVASGSERYVMLNGQEQMLKPGDMYMRDAQGVISSVLYGPDQRTRITPPTRDALFIVYAPPGVGAKAVRAHLEDIRGSVWLVSPQAKVESLEVCATRCDR
jgi:DNA/RNA-binding domain of Phe-tRNA-synthetase-like protein